MVMNAYVELDEPISIFLTESRFFLEPADSYSFKVVKDAFVQLYVNDELVETIPYTEAIYGDNEMRNKSLLHALPAFNDDVGYGFYLSEYIAKEGDKIRIEASSKKFPKAVVAETSVMETVVFESVDILNRVEKKYPVYEDRSAYDENGELIERVDTFYNVQENFNLKIKYRDKKDERNFYNFSFNIINVYYNDGYEYQTIEPVFRTSKSEIEKIGEDYNTYWYFMSGHFFATNDAVFEQDRASLESIIDGLDDFYYEGNSLMFGDELFDGKSHEFDFMLSINKEKYRYDDYYPDEPDEVYLYVTLSHLSKDYYFYMRSYEAYEDFFPLFSEPVQIYSNVKGGIGLLGSSSSSVVTVRIK